MKCRHCDAPLTTSLIDLGSAPPSNAYLDEDALHKPEAWFPLRVLVCDVCKLVQTEDFAAHDALFTPDYAYFSSFSSGWLKHSKKFAGMMIERLGLDANSHVVEVASNDGYLLQFFKAAGIPNLGIEPTSSTASAARAKGIETLEKFFGVDCAEALADEGRSADLMVANNVLAHVPDINDFVAGFSILLKPGGVACFEFPHLLQLIQGRQFDTIYHEHFSYLSLLAVERIFAANGLRVFDVDQLPTHGGSLRIYSCQAGETEREETRNVETIRSLERDAGVHEERFYSKLQGQAEQIRDDLLSFLIEARANGKKVVGYGAAAKGNTLLNFSGVRPDQVRYVVDLSHSKIGKYMPGSRIPILEKSQLKIDRPDFILILPWNIRDEVVEQLKEFCDWDVKFIVAVPEMRVL